MERVAASAQMCLHPSTHFRRRLGFLPVDGVWREGWGQALQDQGLTTPLHLCSLTAASLLAPTQSCMRSVPQCPDAPAPRAGGPEKKARG